jgi:hypothetical protein
VSELTRRGFVKTSTSAAAGVTVLGALRVAQADARERNPGTEPVVAFVSDPKRGEVLLMVGDREVSRRDPELVSALLRAAH